MFTFVTTATSREIGQLVSGITPMGNRPLAMPSFRTVPDEPGLVMVTVADQVAGLITTSMRRAGFWFSRVSVPAQNRAISRPIVTRAAAAEVRRYPRTRR